jgi:hypothetical protein
VGGRRARPRSGPFLGGSAPSEVELCGVGGGLGGARSAWCTLLLIVLT